jgi:hypothetical protein
MLDLKAKLASAGLVSAEDIERVERSKQRRRERGRSGKAEPGSREEDPEAAIARLVASLRDRPKGEIYETVRRWVDRVRLDSGARTPSATASTFHFPEHTGKIGRLVLEPELVGRLERAEAGVVAFMSNHGLAHAVVPAVDARGIASLMPHWLRVLAGDPRAGALEESPR